LRAAWKRARDPKETAGEGSIPQHVRDAIKRCINSRTKTYRYVLPTQLSAKAGDARVDCRSVQASCELRGAFDARSVCDKVTVPFDRKNHGVLGGSREPYVANPLRIPAITREHEHGHRDKKGFEDLCDVLDYAQRNPDRIQELLTITCRAILSRLNTVRILYPVPRRLSLKAAAAALSAYLSQPTGGLRLQVVATALFRCIGERFGLFSGVRTADVNAADQSTGMVADLECRDDDGHLVMAVEVKDRQITLRHVESSLPRIRRKGIREFIFLVRGGVASKDRVRVEHLVDRNFNTGQNLYLCDFETFMRDCLVLFGEEGRGMMFRYVGEELDQTRADMAHRQTWCNLLSSI